MSRNIYTIKKDADSQAKEIAIERMLDSLLPGILNSKSIVANQTRKKFREKLLRKELDDKIVEIDVQNDVSIDKQKENEEEIYIIIKESIPSENIYRLNKNLLFNLFEDILYNIPDKMLIITELLSQLNKHKRISITVREGIQRFYKEEFEKIITLQELSDEEHFLDAPSKEIILVQNQILEFMKKHPELIYNITHRNFEELIYEILIRLGYDVELTARTRDGGCDLVAFSKDRLGIKTKYIIEAKHYSPSHKVGVGVARQLNTVKQNLSSQHGIIVTSSYFTKDLIIENQKYYGLHLKDHDKLMEWIREA